MDPLPHILAKSARAGRPAETLTQHLAATADAADELRERIGRLAIAEATFDGVFWDAVVLAAICHDAGKVAGGFQEMIAGRIRSWGHRHEVVSLGFLPTLIPDNKRLRDWVAAAVVTHHRPLSGDPGSIRALYGQMGLAEFREELEPVDPQAAQTLAAWLVTRTAKPSPTSMPADVLVHAHQILADVLAGWVGEVPADRGLAAVLLQGAVTLADHLSSAHGALHAHQPLDKDFPDWLAADFARRSQQLRHHQQAAAQTGGHLLLRAPTGSGKTEAALLWAATQVTAMTAATGGTPRVFFTLPYLASINAMADRLGALLGDQDLVGVAHSRAASYHLSTSIDGDDGARKAVSRAAATRLFRETVRVGTPYQLLRGALAGPIHAGILVDAANSVFVLDELHAYDPKRLGYILAATRLWERLGGRVAVLSATLPEALAVLIQETLRADVTTIDAAADASAPARHRIRTRQRHLTDPDSTHEIAQHIAEGQAVLVVANNVADAQHLVDTLAPAARILHGPDAAILLHSRFRRRDRSRIEKKIRDRFGISEAGQGSPRPGLVVATQVVEVSLDVDFDILFTSAAPLEALLQRFGRVNRLGTRPPADVVVHLPRIVTRGNADYADGIYPRHPVDSGWQILLRNDGSTINEPDTGAWLDEVYATQWGQQWRNDVRFHQTQFEQAFLAFGYPFHSRADVADKFDEMFDGTEAILISDHADYQTALDSPSSRAAGRLQAEEYLIPMPSWAGGLVKYDRRLGVHVIDGEYDQDRGLLAVHGPAAQAYRPGEVL